MEAILKVLAMHVDTHYHGNNRAGMHMSLKSSDLTYIWEIEHDEYYDSFSEYVIDPDQDGY